MAGEIFKRMRENLENHSMKINSDGTPQNKAAENPLDHDMNPPVTEEYEQPINTDGLPQDPHPALKAENSIPSEPASNNPLDTPEQGGLVAFAADEPKIMEVDTSTFGSGPGNAGSYQSSETETPYRMVGTKKKVGGMTDQ